MLRALLAILALWILSPLSAAPVFQTLAEFERLGTTPAGSLVLHADGNYYGTTITGGRDGFGTVYKMTPAGVVTTLVSFTGGSGAAKGAYPSGVLCVGSDGALFGTTNNGGAEDYGTAFKVTTAGVFTSLLEFTGIGGSAPGSVPNPLFLHTDGYFYGSTQAGGSASDFGTIFKMDSAGALTTLASFSGMTGIPRGSTPLGRLIVDGATIYGTAQWGGAYDCGTVFSLPTSGATWATLATFSGITAISSGKLGCGPVAGLTLVGATLYGTTALGGPDDFGTLFKVSKTGTGFVSLRSFAATDGSAPAAQLLAPGDGFLYGSTSGGGAGDSGIVFRFNIASAAFSTLYTFTASIGAGPHSGLIIGQNSDLFGTTEAGGPASNGTAFRLSLAGSHELLAAFTTPNGWEPVGAPLATTGGITVPLRQGGANGDGTALLIAPDTTFIAENTFSGTTGAPAGGLIESSGQRLGLSEKGILFSLTPTLPPQPIAALTSATGPGAGELYDGGDGFFYGTSPAAGVSGLGTVFRIATFGPPSVVATFTGQNGSNPSGPLARGADGNYYGTTESGGASGSGTVFKVEQSGAITTVLSFSPTGPRIPKSGLIAAPGGDFFGTTSAGGTGGRGTVFRITPLGALTVLAQFTGTSGATPGDAPGQLLAAYDGTIYGATAEGGAGNCGTLFRITTGGTFAPLFAFTGTSGTSRGKNPISPLRFGPGSALHGIAPQGGTGGGGTVFRIIGTGPHTKTRPAVRLNTASLQLQSSTQTGGENTTVVFDYGPTPALGSTTAPASTTNSGGADEASTASIAPPAPLQTVYFRARATNASGTSQGSQLSYTAPTAIAQWKIDNLGDANAPDLADSDADGLANLLEYALLTHPAQSNSGPLPSRASFPEGTRLTLSLSRDPLRNDITIEIQASPAPSGPWTTIATSANGGAFSGPGYLSGEIAGTAVRTVQIKDSAATPAESSRFMRVRVVH